MLAFSFSLSIVFSSSSGSVQCSVSTIPSFYNFCFKLKTTEDYRRRKSRERKSAISANCISRAWVHSVWKCWNLESKNEKRERAEQSSLNLVKLHKSWGVQQDEEKAGKVLVSCSLQRLQSLLSTAVTSHRHGQSACCCCSFCCVVACHGALGTAE